MRHCLIIAILFFSCHSTIAQLILLEHPPKHYICYRTGSEMFMDGMLDEKAWKSVDWTDTFIDIEGDKQPRPYYETKVKMLWDDSFLYIAAQLEEPQLWATYTQRESVIFHENDFEVFIDPNGDTHNYYEYEVNALGTEWDLMLTKPYRFGGKPINSWDIVGLKCGIHLQGTLNVPSDKDSCWTIEMAIPWESLQETYSNQPMPKPGDQWKINFSRVQWRLDIVDGKYTKTINPKTGKEYPEHNWVWSPQHTIDMHKPEYWGIVQYSNIAAGEGKEKYVKDPDFETKVILRAVFDAQQQFKRKHKRFALTAKELNMNQELLADRSILFKATNTTFTLSSESAEKGFSRFIREDSKMWKGKSSKQ